jgi:hypothetical protein
MIGNRSLFYYFSALPSIGILFSVTIIQNMLIQKAHWQAEASVFGSIQVAKSLSDSRQLYIVIPAEAWNPGKIGSRLCSGQSRGTRDWTPAFAGVTSDNTPLLLAKTISISR